MKIDISKAILILRYWFQGRGYIKALKALEYSTSITTGFRKDRKTPNIHHPLSVTFYLKTMDKYLLYPEETYSVALMHDLGEDYHVSAKDVEKNFGSVISQSFKCISDYFIDDEGNADKSKCYLMSQYYDDIEKDPIASVVKASDRINNIQTMIGAFSVEKMEKYIEETKVNPLAMIKEARRNFPEQEPIYENAKHILLSQIELLEALIEEKKFMSDVSSELIK